MGVYQRENIWWIDYYRQGRRYREAVGPTKAMAELALKKRHVEIAENKFLDVKKQEKIRFEDFADEYLELHCKQNHKSYEKSALTNIKILKRFFSGKYLYEITPVDIEKFKSERQKQEVTPATVNRSLTHLKCLFNRASDWGKFNGVNPVTKVKFLKEDNKRVRYLEKEEITKLLPVCRSYLNPIVIVALNTGMRRGEILSLKWHDVDFRRNIIYLLNTKNSDKREIPMNEQVKTALIRVRKHPASPFIFYKKDGSMIADIKKSFATAMLKAKIKGFRFHDLRHTFASHLVMSGIDLNTVRELMGHKSLDMTLRYSHLSPDHKRRAVDNLGKLMSNIWSDENKGQVPVQELSLNKH